jgi:hypothetical protein
VTIAIRPLIEAGQRDKNTVSENKKEKYFCGRGWTGGQITFVKRQCGIEPRNGLIGPVRGALSNGRPYRDPRHPGWYSQCRCAHPGHLAVS